MHPCVTLLRPPPLHRELMFLEPLRMAVLAENLVLEVTLTPLIILLDLAHMKGLVIVVDLVAAVGLGLVLVRVLGGVAVIEVALAHAADSMDMVTLPMPTLTTI